MNLEVKNVICIGDTITDFEMSKNSNLLGAILVESGQIPINQLLKYTKNCVGTLAEVNIEKISNTRNLNIYCT